MISKAQESLECERILSCHRMPDGVANRAYYAVYQAGWHYLVASGHEVPDRNGNRYWPHRRIIEELEIVGMQPVDNWEKDFYYLQQQRVKADYSSDSVHEAAMGDIIDKADEIVRWVIDHDPGSTHRPNR